MTASTRPETPFEARNYVAFFHALKSTWRGELYRRTVAEAEAIGANDPFAIERALAGTPNYGLYAWLERNTQHFTIDGRWGLWRVFSEQQPRLSALLDEAETRHPERLHLDPSLALPDYLTDTETHQYPGGLWATDVGGFVLEGLTEKTSFSMIAPDLPLKWYAEHLRDRFAPKRLLDMGCARARGTRELKRAMPDTEIHGCDLCGPILRLGHLRNIEAELDITLWQRNAEDTGFEAESFDLVTSHWLIHETPPSALRRIMREGLRLLRPGGTYAMYDMYLTPGGAVGEWLHAGYAARNNEPFAYSVAKMDMRRELEAAGFVDVDIALSGLQATPEALRGELPENRTHYMTVITARKAG